MGAEADAAAEGRKAAMIVRRVMLRLKAATPENFDALEKELSSALEENVLPLGTQLEKIQEESDKALTVARKRIESIKEQRKKDAEKSEKPKEMMKELSDLVESLEADTLLLTDGLADPTMSEVITELADGLREQFDSFVIATDAFKKENDADIKKITLTLPELQKEYAGLNMKILQKKQEAQLALTKAKKNMDEHQKKKIADELDAAKPQLQAELSEVDDWVKTAGKDLETAEDCVYPFSRGKKMTEAEINAKTAKADTAISAAHASIQAASEKTPKVGEDADEALRPALEAWLKIEAKKPRMKLSQFQARIRRCSQLVKIARAEIQKGKNEEIVLEMKPKLLVQIKGAMDIAHLDAPMKEIEKEVEPFSKVIKKSVNEMMELGDKALEGIEAFKASMEAARSALLPIDTNLDKDVQKQLKNFLAAEVKKPMAKLTVLESRLAKAETLVTKYRSNAAKNRIDELVNELKPALLEKVKNGSGQAIQNLEDMVKTCEKDIEPFARGCSKTASDLGSLADQAAASAELAKTSADNARGDVCPIDDSLDEQVKKELQAFIKPEIKKSAYRLQMLERRLRRCTQIIKSFRGDIEKLEGQRTVKVKAAMLDMLRKLKAQEKLSAEQLFKKFKPAKGLVSEAAFQKFFQLAGHDGDMPAQDRASIFKSYLKDGKKSLNEEDFKPLSCTFMKVLKGSSLTDGASIANAKAVKQLKLGQVVEALGCPQDEESGVSRVHVKILSCGTEGWATVKGNAGTIFLKECDAPAAPKA